MAARRFFPESCKTPSVLTLWPSTGTGFKQVVAGEKQLPDVPLVLSKQLFHILGSDDVPDLLL